jgi:TnpA family transposase
VQSITIGKIKISEAPNNIKKITVILKESKMYISSYTMYIQKIRITIFKINFIRKEKGRIFIKTFINVQLIKHTKNTILFTLTALSLI